MMKINQFRNFTDAMKKEWRRKMTVFSFFLAISLIIWFLNALSKDYTTEIKYPITYSKFPQGKVIVNNLPNHLMLRVNAHGYALLSYKLINRPLPINFSVNSYAMNRIDGDSTRFYLLTNSAKEQVSKQLSAELQLMDISPDSLVFQFANYTEKTVPVKGNIAFEIDNQFTLVDSVVISPDSILVSGPDIFLDTLTHLTTNKLSLGLLDKSFSGVVQLNSLPHLKYDTDKIRCNIKLEKMTEVQVQVPIQINGLPDSIMMQTFPQYIKVLGKIGLSKYERIVPEAFRAEINYRDVFEEKNKLQVNLKTVPEELESISYYPQSVEYLLSVK